MRDLPLADSSPQAAQHATQQAGGWGFAQGLLTAGLLLAAILTAVGGYFWINEPPPPAKFDAALRIEHTHSNIDGWSAHESFEAWRQIYRPLVTSQIEELINPLEEPTLRNIALYRMYRWTFLGLAALVGLGAVFVFFSLRLASK